MLDVSDSIVVRVGGPVARHHTRVAPLRRDVLVFVRARQPIGSSGIRFRPPVSTRGSSARTEDTGARWRPGGEQRKHQPHIMPSRKIEAPHSGPGAGHRQATPQRMQAYSAEAAQATGISTHHIITLRKMKNTTKATRHWTQPGCEANQPKSFRLCSLLSLLCLRAMASFSAPANPTSSFGRKLAPGAAGMLSSTHRSSASWHHDRAADTPEPGRAPRPAQGMAFGVS